MSKKIISFISLVFIMLMCSPVIGTSAAEAAVVSVSPAKDTYAERYQPIVIAFSSEVENLNKVVIKENGAPVTYTAEKLANAASTTSTYKYTITDGLKAGKYYQIEIPDTVAKEAYTSYFYTYDADYSGIKTIYKKDNFEDGVSNSAWLAALKPTNITANGLFSQKETANAYGVMTQTACTTAQAAYANAATLYSGSDIHAPSSLPDRLVLRFSLKSDGGDEASQFQVRSQMGKSPYTSKSLFAFSNNSHSITIANQSCGVFAANTWYDAEICLNALGENVVVEYAKINGEKLPKLDNYEWTDFSSETFKTNNITTLAGGAGADAQALANYYLDHFLMYEPYVEDTAFEDKALYKFDTFEQYDSAIRYHSTTAGQDVTGLDKAKMANDSFPYYLSNAYKNKGTVNVNVCAIDAADEALKALQIDAGENSEAIVALYDKGQFKNETTWSGDNNVTLQINYKVDTSTTGGNARIFAQRTGAAPNQLDLVNIAKDKILLFGDAEGIPAEQGKWHRLTISLDGYWRGNASHLVCSAVVLDGVNLTKYSGRVFEGWQRLDSSYLYRVQMTATTGAGESYKLDVDDYKISNSTYKGLSIVNSLGYRMYDIQPNDYIVARIYADQLPSEGNPTILLALYDGDQLIDVQMNGKASEGKLSVGFRAPKEGDTSNLSAKAFVWDMDRIIPLADAVSISNR